jgi:hypothetical protein
MTRTFDVAISFASDDRWLAMDMNKLFTQAGISSYCSAHQADEANGLLRRNLYDIYDSSLLNFLIHSKAYDEKVDGSIVKLERQVLFERHVGRGDSSSLFVLLTDAKLPNDFKMCLAHRLNDIGVTGSLSFVFQRLKQLKKVPDEQGGNYSHPAKSEKSRGSMSPCEFKIDPNFRQHRRWKELGDILIETMPPAPKGLKTFLIPSAQCIPFLGHSTAIKRDSKLLATKQNGGNSFYNLYRDETMRGVAFSMRNGAIEYPTAYCLKYDLHLNNVWGNPNFS